MTKLFCVYFDDRPIWRSDAVEPIQAGRARTGVTLDMVGDDTGDSISGENLRYGEMTAWYWVWKNWLPKHPEAERVGFCHYRRFLDLPDLARGRKVRTSYRAFRRTFERHYCEAEVDAAVRDYDIVMRRPQHCKAESPRAEFVNGHPLNAADWDRFEAAVRARNPEAKAEIDRALSTPMLAQELQFVMRRDVFCDFMDWAFSCCRACERQAPWGGESEGPRARTPAFLVERFFMVYLAICRRDPGFRVRELALVKLSARPWWYSLVRPFVSLLPYRLNRRVYDRFK